VPLLTFPLRDAATAGYLGRTIVIPAVYMTVGIMRSAARWAPIPATAAASRSRRLPIGTGDAARPMADLPR